MSTPVAAIPWSQALAWRLGRQFLEPVGAGSVADVVGRLGAIPSVDEPLAELAIAQRRIGHHSGDLDGALRSGEVVDTFAFGGTHLFAASDVGNYLAIRASGRQWARKSWVEFYRLRPEDWPALCSAVRDALADGPLSIGGLGDALASVPAFAHLQRNFHDDGITLVKALAWHGEVCWTPRSAGPRRLTSLAANPHFDGIPELDQAGPATIRSYLHSYGPAPLANLRYRFVEGLSAGRKRFDRWIAELDEEVEPLKVGDDTALALREDVDGILASPAESEAVHLLPGHDPWVMGPGTKDAAVTPAGRRDLMIRKAHPVLLGGVVVGTWKRAGDEVAVAWLDERPEPKAALDGAIERLLALT